MNAQDFIQNYFDTLYARDDFGSQCWEEAIKSIKANNYIKQECYDKLEKILKAQISKLHRGDIFDLYKETEEGSAFDENNDE